MLSLAAGGNVVGSSPLKMTWRNSSEEFRTCLNAVIKVGEINFEHREGGQHHRMLGHSPVIQYAGGLRTSTIFLTTDSDPPTV